MCTRLPLVKTCRRPLYILLVWCDGGGCWIASRMRRLIVIINRVGSSISTVIYLTTQYLRALFLPSCICLLLVCFLLLSSTSLYHIIVSRERYLHPSTSSLPSFNNCLDLLLRRWVGICTATNRSRYPKRRVEDTKATTEFIFIYREVITAVYNRKRPHKKCDTN